MLGFQISTFCTCCMTLGFNHDINTVIRKSFIFVSDHDSNWPDHTILRDRWTWECGRWECKGKWGRGGVPMPVLSLHLWQGTGPLWTPQLTQGRKLENGEDRAMICIPGRDFHMQCPWMLLFVAKLEIFSEAYGWAQVHCFSLEWNDTMTRWYIKKFREGFR